MAPVHFVVAQKTWLLNSKLTAILLVHLAKLDISAQQIQLQCQQEIAAPSFNAMARTACVDAQKTHQLLGTARN